MNLQRHGLLWPQASAWPKLLAQAIQLPQIAAWRGQVQHILERWAQEDWPLITARQSDFYPAKEANSSSLLALGLPLPSAPFKGEKIRLSLRLQADDIARQAVPLDLAQCIHAIEQQIAAGTYVPAQTQSAQLTAMRDLLVAAQAVALPLQVYGSWAWQAMTGLPYLQESSDLDLLCTPGNGQQLAMAVQILQHAEKAMPLDGELVFPGALAVAWREYVQLQMAALASKDTAQILVKTISGARLMKYAALSNSLPA